MIAVLFFLAMSILAMWLYGKFFGGCDCRKL